MDLKKVVKNNLVFLILSVTSVLIVWPLFLPGYFSHHDDLQVMRIFEMRKCIEDFQIPCRWVPDMGYGNGYPLFNYYNPFAFYIGGLLSFIFGFVLSAKILFFIAAILGAFSMYFLIKEIFGKEAAIVGAILYQFAPYKALDLYVRGALAESFALGIAPFCFYFALKLTKKKELKYFLGLSLSVGALLTSHNIMTLFFVPLLLGFCLLFIILEKSKNVIPLILSLILGFGLAAFFIIPSFVEKNLVQIDNLTKLELDFRAHFVTINQLFLDRSWGYGASFIGPNDTISLQIGWPYWLISFIAGVVALILVRKKESKIALAAFLIFILAAFMTHTRSAFIWEEIGLLRFVQFPWRFLSVVIFATSFLGAYLISVSAKKYKIYLMLLIAISTIALNWGYFKPEKFYLDMNDQKKLSGVEWETQQKAAILDYLPKGAVESREAAPNEPIIVSGEAEITKYENRSNNWRFNAKVLNEAKIELPVFDFPNWEVYINGEKITHGSDNHLGRITFPLQSGEYLVKGEFKNTTIRNLANSITLLSIIGLISLVIYGKSRKVFN